MSTFFGLIAWLAVGFIMWLIFLSEPNFVDVGDRDFNYYFPRLAFFVGFVYLGYALVLQPSS